MIKIVQSLSGSYNNHPHQYYLVTTSGMPIKMIRKDLFSIMDQMHSTWVRHKYLIWEIQKLESDENITQIAKELATIAGGYRFEVEILVDGRIFLVRNDEK